MPRAPSAPKNGLQFPTCPIRRLRPWYCRCIFDTISCLLSDALSTNHPKLTEPCSHLILWQVSHVLGMYGTFPEIKECIPLNFTFITTKYDVFENFVCPFLVLSKRLPFHRKFYLSTFSEPPRMPPTVPVSNPPIHLVAFPDLSEMIR